MLVTASDGVPLAVDLHGEGEPVTVAGHGLTGSRHDLAPLAPSIPGTVALFDFRGHGDSGRPPAGSYPMDRFAGDLDAVASRVGATRLVGVSLGGGAALRLLSTRPDRFERLVFVLPARLEQGSPARNKLLDLAALLEGAEVEAVAARVLEEEEGIPPREAFAREARRSALLRMNGDGIPRAIRETLDDPPVRDPEPLRKVTAPALVVGQEGDPVHAAQVARDLAATLPNAELLLYPDPSALVSDIGGLADRVARFLRG